MANDTTGQIQIINKPIFKWFFTLLRMVIGWHLLYEGMVKVGDAGWTSAGYLAESRWFFASFFHWIAGNTAALNIIDFLNIWGLILIGLGLILGAFTRIAAISGTLLLLLYFIANPPFVGYPGMSSGEGQYLFVNKNLIELLMLAIFIFLPGSFTYSIDNLIHLVGFKRKRKTPGQFDEDLTLAYPSTKNQKVYNRRELLYNLASLPVLGLFGLAWGKVRKWYSFEEQFILDKAYNIDNTTVGPDARSGATVKSFYFSQLSDLKGKIPSGKIKDLKMGRLLMGGNLIGGWAHARDLMYVSKLVKAYNTDERVIDTMQLAEQCGVDAVIINPQLIRILQKYWKITGGKMKYVSDCGIYADLHMGFKVSVDGGASACYIQGDIADKLVEAKKFDYMNEALEIARRNGLPAGIGAHMIETIKGAVEYGLKPDFWVKTLHHHNYWSAGPTTDMKDRNWNDNCFCPKPEETIAFMEQLEEPWIAFKVLAAGSISPEDGFNYAFKHGADFICVGMYDFQMIEDTNIALVALQSNQERTRPWRA